MYLFKQKILLFLLIFVPGLWSCQPKPRNNQTGQQIRDTTLIQSKIDLSGTKVGYCTPSLNAPFYVVLSEYVKKYAEDYGMQFAAADGQDDIIRQITSMEDLIASGSKCINSESTRP